MADIEHFISSRTGRPAARQSEIVQPTLLCGAVGAIEGLGAFAITYVVALLYHLLLLNQSVFEFNAPFYGIYGLATGLIYAVFSAVGCARFLARQSTDHLDPQEAVYAWTAAVAIALLSAFLVGKSHDISRVSLTSAYLLGLPLTYAIKVSLRTALTKRIRAGGLHFETLALIGNRAAIANFLGGGDLDRQGYRLGDALYLEHARESSQGGLDPQIISAFVARNVASGTDHIVFVGTVDLDELDVIVTELRRFALNLLYAPSAQSRRIKLLDVVAMGPNNAVRFVRAPMSDGEVLVKRAIDVVLSSVALVVLSPVLSLVALLIKLDSPGPVIFKQVRRGFNGQTFTIWKFRSMTVTESGYGVTQAIRNDSRFTRIGRIIRVTSIDELPQLVNVLTGHMSLVGPRPHAISHDETLSQQLAEYAHRQRIKPGITGWAQVNGYRGETVSAEQIEGRVAHDIHYIDHWSLYLDLWIMLRTVFAVIVRRGAF